MQLLHAVRVAAGRRDDRDVGEFGRAEFAARPVSAMTLHTQSLRGVSPLRRTLLLVPLVEIASSTSPARPCASMKRANTCS